MSHCVRSIGLAWVVVAFSGCGPPAPSSDRVLVVREGVRPSLSTTRDAQITLFGGLPGRSETGFSGRSRGAMLQHTFSREGADFDCLLDAQGHRFVFASTRHSEFPDLYIKSVHGKAVVQLTSDPSSDVQPAFSPDGKRVAFASDRTGNWDIWIIDIDGQLPIQVTHSPMDEIHPSWSPDGTRLVCSARKAGSGQWELWVAPAVENTTSTFIGYGVFPEWSPLDDMILFQRARRRGSRWYSIWTLELVGGEPRYPTEIASSADYAMISPSWSRDGRRIAFTTVGTMPSIDPAYGAAFDVSDIWTIGVDGSGRARLTDGHSTNFSPTWAPDGRVFFTSSRSGHENVWSVLPPSGMTRTQPVASAMETAEEPSVISTRSAAGDGR